MDACISEHVFLGNEYTWLPGLSLSIPLPMRRNEAPWGNKMANSWAGAQKAQDDLGICYYVRVMLDTEAIFVGTSASPIRSNVNIKRNNDAHRLQSIH